MQLRNKRVFVKCGCPFFIRLISYLSSLQKYVYQKINCFKHTHTHTHTRTHIYTLYIYIYIKVKLVTVVEGDPKAPFSLATAPRCRRGCFFLLTAALYSCSFPYNAECLFWVFDMTRPGIIPWSPRPRIYIYNI